MCESFFATLECDLLARYSFQSQAQAIPVAFEFLEGWYNTHPRHSALGHIAPLEFERKHAARSEAVGPTIGFQGSPRIDDHVHA